MQAKRDKNNKSKRDRDLNNSIQPKSTKGAMHTTDPDKENDANRSVQPENNDKLHESLRKNLNKNKSPDNKKNAAGGAVLSPKEDFDKYESEF